MNRILKVFVGKQEQDALPDDVEILEPYDGFAVVEASQAKAKKLAREHLVEDITDLYEIPLPDGAIDTTIPRVEAKGETREHPAYAPGEQLDPGPHHYLVQFKGPIKAQWLAGVRRAGGEPREHYRDFTYVVRADEDALAKIAKLKPVRWVGHLPHSARLDEPLIERRAKGKAPTLPRTRFLPGSYTVEFFGPEDAAKAVPRVEDLGFEVVLGEPEAGVLVVRATDEDDAELERLAKIHGVRKVRRRAVNRPSNDVAATVTGTKASLGAPGLGLSGSGEKVAVCDTGIDTGDPGTIHPDFAGRVVAVKSYPMTPDFAPHVNNPGADDGPADLSSGHGTHVAGSVLGSGAASAGLPGTVGPIRGFAHKAELVFQAIEQACDWKDPADLQRFGRYMLAGIPADLKELFSDAFEAGARIHSNSWGGGEPGAYDESCRALDEWVWEHKDFCVLFAGGNDGSDSDGDGKINPTSVTSPGTAKNCITVGASENRRPEFDAERYGDWWPQDYPAAPQNDDPMANDPKQVVAFSSRGPTSDGRIKPEVVAPGTFILSTRSRMLPLNNVAWGPFLPSRLYFHMGGTSMACPITAGAVAVVREYLRTKQKIKQPTAALLKACLVAGAVRLSGYGERGAVVDNEQGFGRLDLDSVLSPQKPASSRFFEVSPGLKTGKVHSQELTVKSNARPLRVALAYSDFPGPALVNDLNLIVTAPDGSKVAGNQRRGAAPGLDARNNVEIVHVAKPAAGKWTVEVVASNVPEGPQDFALVAVGHL